MQENSPSRRVWKRFSRNILAIVGLGFIVLLVLISILGYLIMPDQTPMANRMHIQLSIKKPGSTFLFFRHPKAEKIDTLSLLTRMIYGQPDFFEEIPIVSYAFKGDSVQITEFTGVRGDLGERSSFYLPDVTLLGRNRVKKEGDTFVFFAQGEKKITKTRLELQNIVSKECIFRRTYWFGTDLYGRDMLSRIILGSRVSMAVGLMAVIISLVLGIVLGSLAGFYGGWVDHIISWLINVVWSLPALLLVIAISFALGKGFWQIFVAVGLTMWVEVARMVRGQLFSVREAEFVEAGRALGFTNFRIIRKHILPNIFGPVLVVASSNFASAILLEAGLSFLGYGAQPPFPTWGSMIKENYGYIIIDAAFLAIIPGVAIMLLVYGFNLLSVGLRDAYDVKAQNTNG